MALLEELSEIVSDAEDYRRLKAHFLELVNRPRFKPFNNLDDDDWVEADTIIDVLESLLKQHADHWETKYPYKKESMNKA